MSDIPSTAPSSSRNEYSTGPASKSPTATGTSPLFTPSTRLGNEVGQSKQALSSGAKLIIGKPRPATAPLPSQLSSPDYRSRLSTIPAAGGSERQLVRPITSANAFKKDVEERPHCWEQHVYPFVFVKEFYWRKFPQTRPSEHYRKVAEEYRHEKTIEDRRSWMQKHKKQGHFEFTKAQKASLKQWFDQLDRDGSGEIDIKELENPLISQGLVRTEEEVQRIVERVDSDSSGQIDFKEFLEVLKPVRSSRDVEEVQIHDTENDPMKELEHNMQMSQSGLLSMNMMNSQRRRKILLDTIMSQCQDSSSGKSGDESRKLSMRTIQMSRQQRLEEERTKRLVEKRMQAIKAVIEYEVGALREKESEEAFSSVRKEG